MSSAIKRLSTIIRPGHSKDKTAAEPMAASAEPSKPMDDMNASAPADSMPATAADTMAKDAPMADDKMPMADAGVPAPVAETMEAKMEDEPAVKMMQSETMMDEKPAEGMKMEEKPMEGDGAMMKGGEGEMMKEGEMKEGEGAMMNGGEMKDGEAGMMKEGEGSKMEDKPMADDKMAAPSTPSSKKERKREGTSLGRNTIRRFSSYLRGSTKEKEKDAMPPVPKMEDGMMAKDGEGSMKDDGMMKKDDGMMKEGEGAMMKDGAAEGSMKEGDAMATTAPMEGEMKDDKMAMGEAKMGDDAMMKKDEAAAPMADAAAAPMAEAPMVAAATSSKSKKDKKDKKPSKDEKPAEKEKEKTAKRRSSFFVNLGGRSKSSKTKEKEAAKEKELKEKEKEKAKVETPKIVKKGAAKGLRVVLVTGANEGVGLEFVKQFAAEPSTFVIALAKSADKVPELKTLVTASAKNNHNVRALRLDVTSSRSIASAIKDILELTDGRVDLLVNAASTSGEPMIKMWEVKGAELEEELQNNLIGPIAFTNALLPYLKPFPKPEEKMMKKDEMKKDDGMMKKEEGEMKSGKMDTPAMEKMEEGTMMKDEGAKKMEQPMMKEEMKPSEPMMASSEPMKDDMKPAEPMADAMKPADSMTSEPMKDDMKPAEPMMSSEPMKDDMKPAETMEGEGFKFEEPMATEETKMATEPMKSESMAMKMEENAAAAPMGDEMKKDESMPMKDESMAAPAPMADSMPKEMPMKEEMKTDSMANGNGHTDMGMKEEGAAMPMANGDGMKKDEPMAMASESAPMMEDKMAMASEPMMEPTPSIPTSPFILFLTPSQPISNQNGMISSSVPSPQTLSTISRAALQLAVAKYSIGLVDKGVGVVGIETAGGPYDNATNEDAVKGVLKMLPSLTTKDNGKLVKAGI